MLSTAGALLRRQHAVWVHLALEACEKRRAGLGGGVPRVVPSVHGVSGQACPEAPLSR